MMEGNHIYWAHTCSRYWIRPLISVISLVFITLWSMNFPQFTEGESRIRWNDLPKATQVENGGCRTMSTNLYNSKVPTLLPGAGQEITSSEWGLVYISHADEARVTSVLPVQVWKKHRGDEQNIPFRNKRQYGKGRTTTFHSVMSDRTVCDDGIVLCLPCPTWQPLATLAMQHLQCAGGGVYGEILSQPFLTARIPFPSCLPTEQGSLYQLLVFFLRVNCSIHSCRFGVYVGGEEFRIFLRGHLKPEPSPAISKCHCPAFWPP